MLKSILFTCLFCTATKASLVKRATGQNPQVWDALDQLKGNHRSMTVDQIQDLWLNVRAGEDFPILSEIPQTNIDCASFHQPGFYADADAGKCQVFHRCDVNGNLTSYLCPNMTLFNQITLVCDWWFNVDCSQAAAFADYSNSRLYQGADVHLLDDQMVMSASGAAQAVSSPLKAKNHAKRSQKKRAQA